MENFAWLLLEMYIYRMQIKYLDLLKETALKCIQGLVLKKNKYDGATGYLKVDSVKRNCIDITRNQTSRVMSVTWTVNFCELRELRDTFNNQNPNLETVSKEFLKNGGIFLDILLKLILKEIVLKFNYCDKNEKSLNYFKLWEFA